MGINTGFSERPQKNKGVTQLHSYFEATGVEFGVWTNGRRKKDLTTRRFPYGIFYLVEEARIVVIAVMHARRDPGA
jgi:hypothetical protein